MPKASDFSTFLAKWRKETAELSIPQAAEELGFSARQYKKIETGVMHPPDRFVVAFAESVGVTIEKLRSLVVKVPPKTRNQSFWPEGNAKFAKILSKWITDMPARDLAYHAQCTPQYISNMMAGRIIPSNEVIKRIAAHCKKNPRRMLWLKAIEGADPSLRDELMVFMEEALKG